MLFVIEIIILVKNENTNKTQYLLIISGMYDLIFRMGQNGPSYNRSYGYLQFYVGLSRLLYFTYLRNAKFGISNYNLHRYKP